MQFQIFQYSKKLFFATTTARVKNHWRGFWYLWLNDEIRLFIWHSGTPNFRYLLATKSPCLTQGISYNVSFHNYLRFLSGKLQKKRHPCRGTLDKWNKPKKNLETG